MQEIHLGPVFSKHCTEENKYMYIFPFIVQIVSALVLVGLSTKSARLRIWSTSKQGSISMLSSLLGLSAFAVLLLIRGNFPCLAITVAGFSISLLFWNACSVNSYWSRIIPLMNSVVMCAVLGLLVKWK
jgi:hypothetical protein